MIDRIKYQLWPFLKVWGRYYWWIVKYRGKKNIPKEVIFGALTRSLERMNDNLEKAYEGADRNLGRQELMELSDALQKAKDLKKEIEGWSKQA